MSRYWLVDAFPLIRIETRLEEWNTEPVVVRKIKPAAEVDSNVKAGLAVEIDVPISASRACRSQVFGAHAEKSSGKPHTGIDVHLFRGPERIFTGHPFTLPIEASANPMRAAGTIKLPDSLPPGDYAVELIAYDGAASPKHPHASQWVDFTLVNLTTTPQ